MELTFIIPTLGRETLGRAVRSILAQTSPAWRAIVVRDNNSAPVPEHNMIATLDLPPSNNPIRIRHGLRGDGPIISGAGPVRNAAFRYVQTDLIGFLDDDDTVGPTYVADTLAAFEAEPELDFLIHSALFPDPKYPIRPGPGWNTIAQGHVSIAFAIRRRVTETYEFESYGGEDRLFLETLDANGLRWRMSHKVLYFVRSEPREVTL